MLHSYKYREKMFKEGSTFSLKNINIDLLVCCGTLSLQDCGTLLPGCVCALLLLSRLTDLHREHITLLDSQTIRILDN